jgi:hypothetical protein
MSGIDGTILTLNGEKNKDYNPTRADAKEFINAVIELRKVLPKSPDIILIQEFPSTR